MVDKALGDYSIQDISELIQENVDAVVVADSETNEYRSILRKGMFESFIDGEGSYYDLIEKLVFHRITSYNTNIPHFIFTCNNYFIWRVLWNLIQKPCRSITPIQCLI